MIVSIYSSNLFRQLLSEIISPADEGSIFYGMLTHIVFCKMCKAQTVTVFYIIKILTVRDSRVMCTFSPYNIRALKGAWASGKVSSSALHVCDEILPYIFFSIANASFPPVNLGSLQSIQHFCSNIHKVICQHCDMTI